MFPLNQKGNACKITSENVFMGVTFLPPPPMLIVSLHRHQDDLETFQMERKPLKVHFQKFKGNKSTVV